MVLGMQFNVFHIILYLHLAQKYILSFYNLVSVSATDSPGMVGARLYYSFRVYFCEYITNCDNSVYEHT